MIFKDETGLTGCFLTCYCFPLEATTLLCDLLFSRTHDLPRVHQCLPQIFKLHSDINTPCLAYKYIDDTYIILSTGAVDFRCERNLKYVPYPRTMKSLLRRPTFGSFVPCFLFDSPSKVSLFVGKNPQISMDFPLVSLMIL